MRKIKICQWKYLSSEEKEEHSKSDEHLKVFLLKFFKFLRKRKLKLFKNF